MKTYGLIGKNIAYSFSRNYFKNKFDEENISYTQYINFDIDTIEKVNDLFKQNHKGYNVTIPYKESVIPYLTSLDVDAENIGAVNVIKIKDNQFIGYNTDYIGFKNSIHPLLKPYHEKALVFGTGGASKAILYALDQLSISYVIISRNHPTNNYQSLTQERLDTHKILINCTPVGTFPDVSNALEIPYEFVTDQHLAYDLIYNPEETQFLKNCKKQGATTKNGLEMLLIQAEKAWEIWNN